MDKYIKKNSVKISTNESIKFQIIEWWAKDEVDDTGNDNDNSEDDNSDNDLENTKYNIYCFGKTDNDKTITCKIVNFYPFYYIKIPNNCKGSVNSFIEFLKNRLYKFKSGIKDDLCKFVYKKDLYGFKNDTEYKYIKLVFKNLYVMNKSKYVFKNPVIINGFNSSSMKYKLYESNFEPFLRFCHIKNIQTANWVEVKNFKNKGTAIGKTNINIEIDSNTKNSIIPIENPTIANFLQASWDIEVYSFDGDFPDPKKKINKQPGESSYPNVIYQMATTFQYFNDKNVHVKYLLTLKECAPITSTNENIVVECLTSEREMIKRWIDIISLMDPDIIYTYNGDSFDWMYLVARCELLNIKDYLFSKISRLNTFDAEIKKEVFSSSAYGDNEYNRVYIPGRLNYDLLIHYKRGIKKYPSYKLDYIAGEILNEFKHEVSVKEIFSYFESGCPEKMKVIGEYCIQDTHLLQKLVDKQLILITIIQLANVTYVPIGFLISRGQTIKVFSQILRKARQMDFLVPNTNFNEDTYPIQIKLKNPINTDDFNINDFVKINIKNDTVMNCKISEIIDDQNIVLFINTELSNIYYNLKMVYNGKNHQIDKLWAINDVIDDSFTGACVLEPEIGFTNNDVAVLDFASLYPTIIISRNLCYSTFVMDDKYLNCKDTIYENISWEDSINYKLNHTCENIMKTGKKKNEVCGKQAYFDVENHYYCRIHDPLKKTRDSNEKYQKKHVDYSYTIVQPTKLEDGTIKHKGVLPALLEDLYAERKKVKKQMANALKENNKLLADILDCTQLGIKISLNSCYGFLGRRQGNLILKELGSIVTAVGRTLIETSKDYAENEFLKYIRENNIINHQLTPKKYNFSTTEIDSLLQNFVIKPKELKPKSLKDPNPVICYL